MAFTVNDFEDLIGLLAEHPEWRERLRPLVVGEELVGVPGRLDRIEANLEAVTVRLDRLTERVDQLTMRVDQLTMRVDQLTAAVQQLVVRADRADGRLGNIEGLLLESRYDRNLDNWLGAYAARPQLVSFRVLDKVTEAIRAGEISPGQISRLRDLDLLVRGGSPDSAGEDLLLAVEISNSIDKDDLRRAKEAAEILQRVGYRARAVVGGYRIHPAAEADAAGLDVVVDLHRPPA